MTEQDLNWLEAAWEDREERVYPSAFGAMGTQIYPLPGELFTDTFRQDSFDPRWLHYGVFESPPSPPRDNWLYVTSGMSNAWDDERPDPSGESGLGSEFVFECPRQAPWAIQRVQQVMAFQILISVNRYRDAELLDDYDRIPLGGPITAENSPLTHLMVVPPPSDSPYPSSFQLSTGIVRFLSLIGITAAEAAFARESGGAPLLAKLRAANAYPVTDPARCCTIETWEDSELD